MSSLTAGAKNVSGVGDTDGVIRSITAPVDCVNEGVGVAVGVDRWLADDDG